MGWAARGRRRAGVWYDPGLDRADHDRHPSSISDALGVSTRKVKTITEELCGRTFSGQHGQPGQTVYCTALRRTGLTRRIRIWCCMYATRNTTRIGPYARDPPLDRAAPPQHRGWAPHRVRSRARDRVRRDRNAALVARPPAERTLSGIERGEHVHSWPSAGSPSQHHRSGAWALGCRTIAAFVLTAIDRRYVRRGSPARPVHPVRGGPGVRRGRPPGRRTGPWALVNEAFAKRFGGGRRTVIGTRLQMTAIDVDDQGREMR